MTETVLPNQRELLSIKDGMATVRQGSLRTRCVELEGAEMGGLGESTYTTDNLVGLMVRTERRTITDFYRMQRKWENERIPVIKEERKQKMIERFGTTRSDQLFLSLYAKMLADPRISVKTRKGQTIKTTLADQKAFSAERFASELERKTT